jgi:hypothetical protein
MAELNIAGERIDQVERDRASRVDNGEKIRYDVVEVKSQLDPVIIRLTPAPDVTVLEWAKLNQVVYAAVLKAVKDAGLESRVR